MNYHDAVSDAKEALERAERKYLEKHGWRYTCNTPSCHWLWEKKLPDGRTVLTNTDTAISMQEHADDISPARMPLPTDINC